MAKTKFICNSCGFESGKWYGKCPECGSWNSFEEVSVPEKASSSFGKKNISFSKKDLDNKVQKISQILTKKESRIATGFEEFDRVMGGSLTSGQGIVPGSVTLLSGDPGIGKSTLLLQLALNLAGSRGQIADSNKEKNADQPSAIRHVLYISGEESEHQVKLRAERIVGLDELSSSSLLLVSTTNIDMAAEIILQVRPSLVIVDSVQTMATEQLPSFPGSVPQIRYVTSRLVAQAKSENIPVFLVGHVTKEGIVAGPQLLSHMVDTVLYLEGDTLSGTRILRAFKNRFGDTSEVGIFVMEEAGLVEIKNAENFFLNLSDQKVPGSCTTVTMEGSRPLLVEIQALVVPTTFAYPRRVAQGITDRRLELLLAVLQKQAKLPVERMDVFLNIVGGLNIRETAADFAACMAIASSFKNKPLGALCAIGEVGLLGELKLIPNLDKRIREAKKFGFARVASAQEFQNVYAAARTLLA